MTNRGLYRGEGAELFPFGLSDNVQEFVAGATTITTIDVRTTSWLRVFGTVSIRGLTAARHGQMLLITNMRDLQVSLEHMSTNAPVPDRIRTGTSFAATLNLTQGQSVLLIYDGLNRSAAEVAVPCWRLVSVLPSASNTNLAGSYGTATNVASVAVDNFGRVSNVFNTPITGLLVSKTIITAGTTTYTVPAGVTALHVRMVGAGSGGGGADGSASNDGVGGGGGSGAYLEKWYTGLTPSTATACTVGAGGAGGLAGNNAGSASATDTVFDSGNALGGGILTAAHAPAGGGSMATGTTNVWCAGGAGAAVATNGDINSGGSAGDPGLRQSGTVLVSGNGAPSPLGGGGAGILGDASSVGANATGYGAGGGGAIANSATDRAGGNGAPGVIIVEEYS